MLLTNNKTFANMILDNRKAAFLCIIIGSLVGAGILTVFLLSTERDPFLLENDMSGIKGKTGIYKRSLRLCEMEGCNEKHYANRLCRKHYKKRWDKDNKEHKVKYGKQRYKNNKEKLLKQSKQYQEDNKEQIAEQQKQYRQTLAGKTSSKANNYNRRLLTKDLTKATIQRVYEDNIKKYGVLTCYLCGKPIIFGDNLLKDSLDHLTPITKQGTNRYDNLGIAHLVCNKQKFTKTLEQYLVI